MTRFVETLTGYVALDQVRRIKTNQDGDYVLLGDYRDDYGGREELGEVNQDEWRRVAGRDVVPAPPGIRALHWDGETLWRGEMVLAFGVSPPTYGPPVLYTLTGVLDDATGLLFADGSVDLFDGGNHATYEEAAREYQEQQARIAEHIAKRNASKS